jgi:hypothetical protein
MREREDKLFGLLSDAILSYTRILAVVMNRRIGECECDEDMGRDVQYFDPPISPVSTSAPTRTEARISKDPPIEG